MTLALSTGEHFRMITSVDGKRSLCYQPDKLHCIYHGYTGASCIILNLIIHGDVNINIHSLMSKLQKVAEGIMWSINCI
jgi:hypothetical protein